MRWNSREFLYPLVVALVLFVIGVAVFFGGILADHPILSHVVFWPYFVGAYAFEGIERATAKSEWLADRYTPILKRKFAECVERRIGRQYDGNRKTLNPGIEISCSDSVKKSGQLDFLFLAGIPLLLLLPTIVTLIWLATIVYICGRLSMWIRNKYIAS